MRISLNWLNDYVDVKDENKKELAEKITRTGVNVEKIISYSIPNLVVGYVKECYDHPNSDHLHVCKVELGGYENQIVCGASNVHAGLKVAVSLTGCVLPGDFEIKPSVIRGIESNGMICSKAELGLEEKSDGIMELDSEAVIGDDPFKYLGLDDTIYELDLNPNRNDCLSHLGFAYLAAAVLNKEVKIPKTETTCTNESINDKVNLKVETTNCSMYLARMVKNVKIGPSPKFIQDRLVSAGMRSINNVVDISNYIMLEYGQPLHFFDQEKVGNTLCVRMAHENEKNTTLDGNERTLTSEDVVICNNKDEVVAIAGVMGSLNSEVVENTKDILIESAIFNPYNVRYTSIRLDLRSEASLRFEKILNYEYTMQAVDRACYLLQKYASGEVLKDTLVYDNVDKTPKVAKVTKDRISAVLGMKLTNNDIENAFACLKFPYIVNNDEYTVTIPNRRMDVAIREDLIEEVGCLYGYDNIIASQPIEPIRRGVYNPKTLFEKQVSRRLRALGLNNTRTYTLVDEIASKLFDNNEKSIRLDKPLNIDKSIIRKSILPSLLSVAAYNNTHGLKDIAIYEISNVYYEVNSEYIEEAKMGILTMGKVFNNTWNGTSKEYDFYDVKGIIENLLNYLGFSNRYHFVVKDLPQELHPGVAASILVDNENVGFIGKINPNINKENIYVGELSLTKLMNKKTRGPKYSEISKYPSVIRDMAFIMDKNIVVGDVLDTIKKTCGKTLVDLNVFDYYVGERIGLDKKSIAFSLTFNDSSKTLTDEEVTIMFNKTIEEVSKKYNAVLRDK